MCNGGKAMNEAHEDHVILSLKYPSGVVEGLGNQLVDSTESEEVLYNYRYTLCKN